MSVISLACRGALAVAMVMMVVVMVMMVMMVMIAKPSSWPVSDSSRWSSSVISVVSAVRSNRWTR